MDWENIDTMDRDNIPTISWTNIMEMERVGESIEEEEESISSKKSLSTETEESPEMREYPLAWRMMIRSMRKKS